MCTLVLEPDTSLNEGGNFNEKEKKSEPGQKAQQTRKEKKKPISIKHFK